MKDQKNYKFAFLFTSTSCWSKDWGRAIWILANSNEEACNEADRYNFDWSSMDGFLLK